MKFKAERQQVAEIMRKLYAKGLTTISGGNVSCRNLAGYIFITASQTDKSCITKNEIVVFDNNLKNITPMLRPSMEYNIHINIYKNRPDINAIVHSHPIYASAFSVMDKKINTQITGEINYILKEIAEIDYKLMGSPELAEECANKLTYHNVGIMKNHGAITLGKSLFEAYDRMEVLEFAAHINMLIND